MNIFRLMRCQRALNRSLSIAALVLLQFACSAKNDASLVYDPGTAPGTPTIPNNQPPVQVDPNDPSLWIINGGVENGVVPWNGRGATISQSQQQAYAGTYSLLVTNRQYDWQGPEMHLPLNLPSGTTYRVSVWVRLAAGEAPTNTKLTLQRCEDGHPCVNDAGQSDFAMLAQSVATNSNWVQLSGTFTHLSNPLAVFAVYVEAERATASFFVDELTMEIEDGAGPADPNDPAGWITNGGVESGVSPWRANHGNVMLTQETQPVHSGNYSLLVTGRTDDWHGAVMDLPTTLPTDRAYQVSVWVRLTQGTAPEEMSLTLKRWFVGQSPEDYGNIYFNLDRADPVTDAEWVQLVGTFEHPAFDGELQEFYVYVEAEGAMTSYYVDNLQMAYGGEHVFNSDLEDGFDGWGALMGGTATRVDDDAHTGDYSVLVTGRTEAYHGATFTFLPLAPNHRYRFSCWVKMAPEQANTNILINLKITQGGSSTYPGVAEVEGVTSESWVEVTGVYEFSPSQANVPITEIFAYVHTANATAEYLVDDCSVTHE